MEDLSDFAIHHVSLYCEILHTPSLRTITSTVNVQACLNLCSLNYILRFLDAIIIVSISHSNRINLVPASYLSCPTTHKYSMYHVLFLQMETNPVKGVEQTNIIMTRKSKPPARLSNRLSPRGRKVSLSQNPRNQIPDFYFAFQIS